MFGPKIDKLNKTWRGDTAKCVGYTVQRALVPALTAWLAISGFGYVRIFEVDENGTEPMQMTTIDGMERR